MSKNVLVVKCDKEINYDDWDSVVNYIRLQLGEEYHVIGAIKGIDIECVTEQDKVFYIDGDKYSYDTLKKAIESIQQKDSLEEIKEETVEEESKDDNKEINE